MKKSYQIEIITSILIGLILVFIPSSVIINVLRFILGIGLILLFLPSTIIGLNNRHLTYMGIRSLVFVTFGFVIIILGFDVVGTIIGSVLLILLLIDLFRSNNLLTTFKKDLVKYIIALILIVIGINKVVDIVVTVSGIVLIVVGLLSLILSEINIRHQIKKEKKNSNIIDVDFENEEEI